MLNLRGKYYIDLGQKLYPLFRHSSLRVLQGVGVEGSYGQVHWFTL